MLINLKILYCIEKFNYLTCIQFFEQKNEMREHPIFAVLNVVTQCGRLCRVHLLITIEIITRFHLPSRFRSLIIATNQEERRFSWKNRKVSFAFSIAFPSTTSKYSKLNSLFLFFYYLKGIFSYFTRQPKLLTQRHHY